MNITLNHKEIEQAIADKITNEGINVVNKDMNITMVAGRGGNGMSATVELTERVSNNTSTGNMSKESVEVDNSFDTDESESGGGIFDS